MITGWFDTVRGRELGKVPAWFIAGGVLLLSWWVGRGGQFFGIVILAGLTFAILTIKDLRIGLTLLIAMAATVDVPIGTGTQSSINLAMILAALLTAFWLAGILVNPHRRIDIHLKDFLPAILFVVVLFISWGLGSILLDVRITLPSNALTVQAAQVALFILSFAIMMVGANIELEEKWLKVWTAIVVCVAGLGTVGMVTSLTVIRPIDLFQPPIAMGLAILVGQLLLNPALRPDLRAIGWCMIVLWGAVTFLTYRSSFVGGWAPVVIAAVVLVWFRSRALFLVGVALGGIGVLVRTEWVLSFFATKTSSGSFLRLPIWWDIVTMTFRSPVSILLGLGPVNYIWNWTNPDFTFLTPGLAGGVYLDPSDPSFFMRVPAHNMFVDIYAQTGLVGTLLFLWLLYTLIRAGWKLGERYAPGFMRAYVYGVLAGFIGVAVVSGFAADWLIPFVYNITLYGFRSSVYAWFLIGTLIGLYVRGNPENLTAPSSEQSRSP